MTTVQSSWLQQGFFVLGKEGLMPSVREELEKHLGLQPHGLRISFYPTMGKWKHTYWWREGAEEYKEAQFFAQISDGYPVFSLGVAVEKGYEIAPPNTPPEKLMDRTWDWHRLVQHAGDVVALASKVNGPLTIRVRKKVNTRTDATFADDDKSIGWATRAFSRVNGKWCERYIGKASKDVIASHIGSVNDEKDVWAIVHFARDFSPREAQGMSARTMAKTLLAFDPIRRRLRR